MRFLFSYSYKRLLRERIKSITVPLIALTLVVLINTLGGIRDWLENEYEYMLDNFPVVAVLSNLSGDNTDELHIDMQNINLFINPDSALPLYRHVSDLILRRSAEANLATNNTGVDIIGITNFSADERLNPETGVVITFIDEYDESLLQSNEPVVIISKDLNEFVIDGKLSNDISIQLPGTFEERFVPEWNPNIIEYDGIFLRALESDPDDYIVMTILEEVGREYINFEYVYVEGEIFSIKTPLAVIGTIYGTLHNTIYVPFWTFSELLEEYMNEPPYSELLRLTVAENRELSAFKGTASLSFARVRPIHDTRPFAMTVYDSVFYETAEPLLQNKMLVDVATPIMYGISIIVGFLTSMLLTRQRKSEFATMRSVGINRRDIALSALSEQVTLCLIGAALGFALVAITLGYLSVERPLIFLACYTLGAIFSVIKAAKTDVLSILRERE